MKNIITIVFAVTTIFSFTQCSNNSGNDISIAENRAKVITELMDNPTYMQEVMTSMKTKHGEAIVSTSCDMMKSDKAKGMQMMNSMMSMCKDDSSMCKMMMGKTMEMCDMDKEKCQMMMTSMQEHPKGMKDMKDMGMCDMKVMNMEQKKEDYSLHH